MPFRRKTVKRKPIRRRVYRKKKVVRVQRGMRMAVMGFTREKAYFINTLDAAGTLPLNWAFGTHSGYHTLQCSQVFNMQQLSGVNELIPVFKMYKLNCVVARIESLHNTSNYTTGSALNYYGGNIVVHAQKNLTGHPLDTNITEDYWNQNSAKQTKLLIGNRPIFFKVYPKQANITYLDPSTTTSTVKKPAWGSTNVAGFGIPHFGLNMQFSYTNPAIAFGTASSPSTGAPLVFRVTYKYYFQMRGVQ